MKQGEYKLKQGEYKLKNRCGDEYQFELVDENTYTITGDLNYWRFGGLVGQTGIDYSNLGFVDPSGGPFIDIGYKIGDQKVTHISFVDKLLLKVE